MHGANQDHYRANTGSNEGFGEAMRAIENLKRNKIRHSVNIVVSHENLKMMPDFIRILSGLADRLGFTFALPPLDDVGYHSDPYVLSESVASINSLCLEYKQDHCFVYSLPWCTLKKDLLDNLLSRNELMFNCPVNKGKVVVVKENCTLSLCTHLSGVELLGREETQEVLSSSKTFLGFWNSAEMNKIRRSMDVYRHPKCVLCEHRFFCKGGCPLWWGFSDFQKTFTAT